MTVFLVPTIVGVPMAVLPALVFGVGDEGGRVQPFRSPLVGVFVALFAAGGLVQAWWLHRTGRGEGGFEADRDDSET